MARPSTTQNIPWETLPLGEYTDAEIARELGVSHSTVRLARVALGIPVHVPPPRADWDSMPFGQVPDRQIAEHLGLAIWIVRAERRRRGIAAFDSERRGSCKNVGINWDLQPLGLLPDIELARKMHVAGPTVSHARRLRGIPRYLPPRPDHKTEPLAEVTDTTLAQYLGVSTAAVTRARIARRLPPIYSTGFADRQPMAHK